MTTWLLVWLVVTIAATIALAAFLVALVRHGIFVGRAAARMGEEAGSLAREINEGSQRASERVAALSLRDRSRPRR